MNHLLMIALLVTSAGYDAHGKKRDRDRMLADVTQMNDSFLKSYGCYCGDYSLGHGYPKDHVDECCQILNCCYDYLKTKQCDATKTSYSYTYDGKNVECDMTNRSSWCRRRACRCDRYYVFCLQMYRDLFNPDFAALKGRNCSKEPSLSLPFANGNLVQFADMVRRVTGRLPSLFYNGYGCYCGLGGSKQPLDETDWCCHAHDCCYGKMSSLGCDPKLETYSYFFSKGALSCGGKTMCHRMICECDKEAALCFQRAAKTYRITKVYYPNLLCRGATPPC